jgi:tRNA(fMet)-specific endonuclease VapC
VTSSLYLLDTNTCSFIMRSQPEVRDRLARAEAQVDRLAISAVVYSELRDGVLGPRASPRLAALLSDLLERLDGVLPWDRAAAEQTALIRRDLRRRGTPIGPNDSAIAGHALALGAALVTNNVREFSRVAGLALEDWTAPTAPEPSQGAR